MNPYKHVLSPSYKFYVENELLNPSRLSVNPKLKTYATLEPDFLVARLSLHLLVRDYLSSETKLVPSSRTRFVWSRLKNGFGLV